MNIATQTFLPQSSQFRPHSTGSLKLGCLLALTMLVSWTASAITVDLQNDTATFSQTGFLVATSTDGILADANGWAIAPNEVAQVAVWETVSDQGSVAGTTFTFVMAMLHSSPDTHTLGRFRLSYTTDDRSTFADGLSTGGDVNATWTVLVPTSQSSVASGVTLTVLPDDSILAGGTNPSTDTYTITADVGAITGITGFRLEVIEDPSLPFNGPGRQPTNGNFVLTEIQVDAQMLPVTLQTFTIE